MCPVATVLYSADLANIKILIFLETLQRKIIHNTKIQKAMWKQASFQNVTKQSQQVIPKGRKSRKNSSYIVILKKFNCKLSLVY